jgi:hypothetical protein
MADMLTALLVRGEQHPLLPMVLPAQAMQHNFRVPSDPLPLDGGRA